MNKLSTILFAILGLWANFASAAITVNIQQSGSNLVVSTAGTLNSSVCTSIGAATVSAWSGISPTTPSLAVGDSGSAQQPCVGTAITPTSGFGTGGTLSGSVNTGVSFYFDPNSGFWGPTGWNSSTPFTSSMTFAGASFASAGVTPGSYVYTFTNGATTDTLTINAINPANVPTLSEWGILILAGLMALVGGRKVWRRNLLS